MKGRLVAIAVILLLVGTLVLLQRLSRSIQMAELQAALIQAVPGLMSDNLNLGLRPPCLASSDVPGDPNQLLRRQVVLRKGEVPNASFDVKPSCGDFINLDATG